MRLIWTTFPLLQNNAAIEAEPFSDEKRTLGSGQMWIVIDIPATSP